MAKPCIVCVDDEPLVLDALTRLLEDRFGHSYEVVRYRSGEEALSGMEGLSRAERELALIVCDQIMPGLQGDHVLAVAHQRYPAALKVLLTGQAGLEAVIRAINEAGLNKYIEKPWEAEALFLAAQNLLAQYELSRKLEAQQRALERRNAHLEALHRNGLVLASSFEIEFILRHIAQAASLLVGDAAVEVFYAGSRVVNALPRWYPDPPEPGHLPLRGRERLAAVLARQDPGHASNDSEGSVDLPELGLPDRAVIPIERQNETLGLIVVGPPAPLDKEQLELLTILTLQAGTSLHNIHLTQERIHSERLSAIGRMIGSVVHDLRNPITAARGYAGMLAAAELPAELRAQYARFILEECDRLGKMSEDLLDFTRVGQGKLNRRWLDLNEYLGEIARQLETQFKDTSRSEDTAVKLEMELGYSGPLFADPDKLTRAILNVATNARQAMPGGGTFSLRSERRGNRVRLWFADTGTGIPAGIKHRIFEPFFTHGKTQGVGLGTSIAKKIVEDHGGEIHLESQEGVGTIVEFSLPLEPAGAPPLLTATELEDAQAPAAGRLGGK
jgi:signal transduction histidine kinase